ncbi:hypothetical protein E1B28_002180 [Marasmius oreades]|uniref:Uncharacterized protein n=1 Tax=Marasmius oreades TaxID=181124 RepID=A0A9P7RMC5_9AGAR|nr:uncharacterized protein E1B28_002180 [Marasmius oreades]KAG7086214.1 hypothetical protein E1B28_002180 [Marasmius oreades]
MPKPNTRQLFGVSDPVFDSSCKLVTSPFFSSAVLATIRLMVALYTMTTLIVILVMDGEDGKTAGRDFSYFTQLTYIGICAYYWASFVQTASYEWRRRKGKIGYLLQRWPKFLQVLHLILGTTIVNYPILVTLVFWVLLADSRTLGTPTLVWRNVSIHALNSVFCLFEVLFTHSPRPRWIFLIFTVLILGGYCGLAYVTKKTQGFYTYSFLNPDKGPILAVYLVGIAVAECIIFALVWGLMSLRQRMFPVKETRERLEDAREDHGSLGRIRSEDEKGSWENV